MDEPHGGVDGVVVGGISLIGESVGEKSAAHVVGEGGEDGFGDFVTTGDEGEAGEGDEGVAAPVFEPGVAGDDGFFVGSPRPIAALDDELIGGEGEEGEEIILGIGFGEGGGEFFVAGFCRGYEFFLIGPGNEGGGGDEADGDAGGEGVFENAGGPEVFAIGVAALTFDAEGKVVPPAGVDVEFIGVVTEDDGDGAFGGLDGEGGIGLIGDGPPGALVELDGAVEIAAGEEWLHLEFNRAFRFTSGDQGVADDDGVFAVDEGDGFFDNGVADLIAPDGAGGGFEGEEVFVALGLDDVGEFVGGEVGGDGGVGGGVEGEDDSVFHTGEDYVALDGGMDGDDEEAVIFAGVGPGDGTGGVAAEAIGAEPFGVDGGIEITAGVGIEGDRQRKLQFAKRKEREPIFRPARACSLQGNGEISDRRPFGSGSIRGSRRADCLWA